MLALFFSKDHQWTPNDNKNQKIGIGAGTINTAGAPWSNQPAMSAPFGGVSNCLFLFVHIYILHFITFRWVFNQLQCGNHHQQLHHQLILLLPPVAHQYVIILFFFFFINQLLLAFEKTIFQTLDRLQLLFKYFSPSHFSSLFFFLSSNRIDTVVMKPFFFSPSHSLLH